MTKESAGMTKGGEFFKGLVLWRTGQINVDMVVTDELLSCGEQFRKYAYPVEFD
jgi:hypothetical protein